MQADTVRGAWSVVEFLAAAALRCERERVVSDGDLWQVNPTTSNNNNNNKEGVEGTRRPQQMPQPCCPYLAWWGGIIRTRITYHGRLEGYGCQVIFPSSEDVTSELSQSTTGFVRSVRETNQYRKQQSPKNDHPRIGTIVN